MVALTTTHKDLIRCYLKEGRTASNMAAALGIAEKDVAAYIAEVKAREVALERARAS